jgi:hypothetical protein
LELEVPRDATTFAIGICIVEGNAMKTIPILGGQRLQPELAFPNNARILAVELIPERAGGSLELVSYIALFQGSAEQLFNSYRNFYRSAVARWTGRLQQQERVVYSFAVAVRLGQQGGRVVFIISDKITKQEQKLYNLSTKEAERSIIHATLWASGLDKMLKASDGLRILLV